MNLDSIGIRPQKINQFNSYGISTVEELAAYLPRNYKDFSHVTGFLPPEEESCVVLRLDKVKNYYRKMTMTMAFCTAPDGTSVHVMWFQQQWRINQIARLVGKDVFVAGKVVYNEEYNNYTINSPAVFEANEEYERRIYPVYKTIRGMTREYLINALESALREPSATSEILPADILKEYGYVSRREALIDLHRPRTQDDIQTGKARVLFDDLLYYAISLEHAERKSSKGSLFSIKSMKTYHRIIENLPYELTEDQKASLDSMIKMAKDGRRINALLQGDVGCGKSIVAFLLMSTMADSGYQAAIMAPTQVLARQHYNDLVELMEPMGLKVAFIGSTGQKKSERTKLLRAVEAGEVQFVVGTQAILSESVRFKNLAMIIVDEEHRFGVTQRRALVERSASGVHSITMSATPIPRSLAQVVYGDYMQLFTIRTMPAGRRPVLTGLATGRDKIYRFIIREARQGHQTYVVCPLIDKNEDLEGVKSVDEIAAEYHKALDPYGIKIETLTGRTKKDETDEILRAFKAGEINVLISTSVIEVGVNVPTATLIVVSNAERFGLATLHQLRGRVGRSDLQAYCVLEQGEKEESVNPRLSVMCASTDGFKIAEEDLKLRGAGDFIGTVQHGENKYVSLMLSNPEVFQQAKKAASKLLDRGDESPIVLRALEAEGA